MTPTQIDNLSRDKIVDIDIKNMKNYFVIANAGSGKTSILVNRMVAMVEAGIDVSKICAITFTKNAASEFLNRFQATLRERADKSKTPDDFIKRYPGDLNTPTDESRINCLKALKNINLCFLGTIDAFCNKVLSEFPLDANIPSSSIVIEEEEEMKLYKDEYEKISRDELSPLYKKFCNFDLLNSKSQEVFSNSIKAVIDASSLKLEYIKPTKDLKEVLNEIIDKYEGKINEDINELINLESSVCMVDGKNRFTEKFSDAFDSFKKSSSYLKSKWKIENLISRINEIKNSVSGLRFDEEPKTNIIKFTQKGNKNNIYYQYALDNEFEELLSALDDIKYSYSIDFLFSASERIKSSLKKLGKLTFTDYLLIFRDMLKADMNNDMNIINHIREKYSYFLIDESQDTSPFQTELFLYLTSSKKALSTLECKPIPGSLFILGDPKQSIYRFRGADVESYMRTKDLFNNVFDSNNEVLMLTKNFRSTSLLIDYFNCAFHNKLDNYEPIPECEGIGGTSGLFTFTNYIDVIKTMFDNEDYKVSVKINGNLVERAPMFKDFMIITKNKFNHKQIIKELNDNHIPVYVEGKIDIASANIIKSVYAIYKYIASSDIISSGALYNLLCSPIFKLNIKEIMCKTLDNIPSDIKKYINVIDKLKEINNPIIIYEKILDSIKLFDKVSYSNMDYAYYILEKLKEAYRNALITDLNDAINLIENYIDTSFERIMSMDYKPNAVYLANLHKVKGLESPIVLLMKAGVNLNKKCTIRCDFGNNKSYVFRTDAHAGSFGGPYYTIETKYYENEEKEELNQSNLEDERLKYVAATRARSYLLIDNSNNGFWNSLVNDKFKEFIVEADSKIDFKELDISNICKDVSINFDNTNTFILESPSKLELERVSNIYSSDSQMIEKDYDVKLKGTIIHRLMEVLVNSKCKIKKEELIDMIIIEYGINNLPNSNTYMDMLNKVYDKMMSGGFIQESGRDGDILEVLKYAKCYCEVPFSYTIDNKVWYGNIDLLYELDGKYYIVDYKTNLDGKDLEKEYKNQLDAYKKALKEIENIDAETYIYHIDVK